MKHNVYVLIKILKFCTGSSAKSYQCKFGISDIVNNRIVAAEELGNAIQDVIHFQTLRGKFSSVHPELRREGIVRVDVEEEGLNFVRDTGATATSPTCGLTGCGVKVGKGGLCTGCRSVNYCSKEHQRRDWPSHKLKFQAATKRGSSS